MRPYDHIAEKWHSRGRGQDYVARVLSYVDKVLADIPAGAKILDLGCGTGEPVAAHVVQRGYKLVGIDESAEMLKIAKTAIPEAEFVQGDMVYIHFAGSFAAVIAWDSLFHVERKYHAGVFSQIHNLLDRGGKLLLSVGGSDSRVSSINSRGDGFTSDMYGHQFFYSAHAPEVTLSLLESAGFYIELWEVDDPSSRGHLAVIASKV